MQLVSSPIFNQNGRKEKSEGWEGESTEEGKEEEAEAVPEAVPEVEVEEEEDLKQEELKLKEEEDHCLLYAPYQHFWYPFLWHFTVGYMYFVLHRIEGWAQQGGEAPIFNQQQEREIVT